MEISARPAAVASEPLAHPEMGEEWVAELKLFAGQRLPAHLVPDLIVPMGDLPRTPNGKVDRLALPTPGLASAAGERAPRTAEEIVLRKLVADVLELSDVPLDADFFALGGDSLLAMRLVAGVRSTLGSELGVRDVFDKRTVAKLAAGLRKPAGIQQPLIPRDKPARIPLSYSQLRMWFLKIGRAHV